MTPTSRSLPQAAFFSDRHIGPNAEEQQAMLEALGEKSLDGLVDKTVPASIRLRKPLNIPANPDEHAFLQEFRKLADKNQIFKSYIGMGYHGCITPPVIQRNILENPGWYTQYTPYQAEIAQGRLEALLNFQTLVSDLTGLPVSNASLLDEATAAAEAMNLLYAASRRDREAAMVFFASDKCHPQTLAVLETRARPLGIELRVGSAEDFDFPASCFGALLQYPDTDGAVIDPTAFCAQASKAGIRTVLAADLLALTLLKSPGECGADIAVGSSQRFGVPMGYGGPHAAFFATREEFKRILPGRIIGVSVDARGKTAYRMALQTREQHIRREKATSNICTSQVLLAVMAGMYAVYHGPQGLKAIASRVHALARKLDAELVKMGCRSLHDAYFDTLRMGLPDAASARRLAVHAEAARINFRLHGDGSVGISLDESVQPEDFSRLLSVFAQALEKPVPDSSMTQVTGSETPVWPPTLTRTTPFLTHPVFNTYRSETNMLRYMRSLESKDLSLTTSMIPLGSCTMKLNATVEMMPVTWPEFAEPHPFAPRAQLQGYAELFRGLESALAEITGLPGVSLQPNAGSQGEYAGLLVIRAYQAERGESQRNVVLIPSSAHGTNPASAVMAGFQVVVVKCNDRGDIDFDDLQRLTKEHKARLGALMITYPSTHGVFEEGIQEICRVVHDAGGQVYMDGANMNAQVGLCNPAMVGADVCHLNLHKTFCIPHGGGGPGMGPICVAQHLVPFLPGHPVVSPTESRTSLTPVSAAPWGSSSILPISWAYIRMMGGEGLTQATKVAILNANYLKRCLEKHYPVLYQGKHGTVAHEMILDCRAFKASAGIEVEDIAKRLMDYNFHAPTVSFPVPGTLMIEPTESESKAELDRFCEALISIREEIAEIEAGRADRVDNPLKNAPHTADMALSDEWKHSYSREKAVFPLPYVRHHKFWPSVARINAAYGDKNLMCACPPLESYQA